MGIECATAGPLHQPCQRPQRLAGPGSSRVGWQALQDGHLVAPRRSYFEGGLLPSPMRQSCSGTTKPVLQSKQRPGPQGRQHLPAKAPRALGHERQTWGRRHRGRHHAGRGPTLWAW